MDLPMRDEPLVLADGTKIDPSGKVIKDQPTFIEVPSNSEAQRIVARTRKTVADLPIPPAQLSGVALVAFYTLYGLNDLDVAIALDNKLSIEQIENIREQPAYQEFMEAARANLMHTETSVVRELFEQNAKNAATKILSHVESENDVLSFKAAQDILDRAGHRPADIVEHRHKMDAGALNIVITKRDETKAIPMIDVTPNIVENANGS